MNRFSWALLFLSVFSTSAAPLTGDAAIQHLKAAGQYDSLAAAITGARYAAKAADGADAKALAQNPAHGINSAFTPEGLTLTVRSATSRTQEITHTVSWRLESLGYGATQIPVPPGELKVNGQRVEITRGDSFLIANRKSEIANPKLVEWFNNTPGGLEHGFTLAERPAVNPRGQPLRLVLAVTGDLTPQADAAGQKLLLRDLAGQTVLTYEKLKVWDATGAELPATMQMADGKVTLTVSESAANYPLTIDPTFASQQAYLKASNTDGGDNFGYSVAVSGDTVVVGAYGEASNATGVNGNDNSAAESGAAYVFVRSGTTWTQQAYLKASNTDGGDNFGRSVAVSGDTVVVGATHEDSNATGINGDQSNNSVSDSGAAYVFVRSGTIWTQQAYLKGSNADSDYLFGWSVAVSGDTVVVGAIGDRSNATGVNGNHSDKSAIFAGAAYVFVRSGAIWTQQAYLKASNTDGGYNFGCSVAVSRDTVVVGAYGEAFGSGAAYVFVRSGTTWTQQAYLKASHTGGYLFGNSVAVSGDTAVVGAVWEASNATGVNGNQIDNSATDSGAAYVFVRSGTTWTQQAYLKASNTGAGDFFGDSVAVSGDTVVVGALGEDSNATGVNGNETNDSAQFAGAAYVFLRNGTNWTQQAYLKASNTGAGDQFGRSVAVSGDTVVVGANGEASNATGVNGDESDNSASASGAAYIFRAADPNADSDGDRLLDIWETEGGGIDIDGDGIIDLDLYALGARPDHKDLFVEIDAAPLAFNNEALARVVFAFDQAPVPNPDGTTGIRLHLEVDESGIIPLAGVTGRSEFPFGFKEAKTNHFGTVAQRNDPNRANILAAKAQVYRYCLAQDFIDFGAENGYNGTSEIGGNDFVVHLGAKVFHDGFRDIDDQASTFMHELGHTLGLQHGGGVDEIIAFETKSWHGKPNYPSIMNYALSHPLKKGQNKLFWKLDYSREQLADLSETSLNESAGIPSTLYRNYLMPIGVGPADNRHLRLVRLNGSAADFNGDGDFDQGVSADLNFIGAAADFGGVNKPSPGETMKGYDDWANLKYAVIDDTRQLGLDISVAEGCPSMAALAFLEANVPADPDSFEGWQARFPTIVNQNGFSDDPDGDGVVNGFERYLGTDPGQANTGAVLMAGSSGAAFRHSRSKFPGADVLAAYEWSTDLTGWQASGATNEAGISVKLHAAVVDATGISTDILAVTPEVTGAVQALFFRLRLQFLNYP